MVRRRERAEVRVWAHHDLLHQSMARPLSHTLPSATHPEEREVNLLLLNHPHEVLPHTHLYLHEETYLGMFNFTRPSVVVPKCLFRGEMETKVHLTRVLFVE